MNRKTVIGKRYTVIRHLFGLRIAVYGLLFCLIVAGCTSRDANRAPAVVYLWFDSAEIQQLFLTDLDGNNEQLTQSQQSIKEYAASPSGEKIAYVTQRADGVAQLWLLDNVRGRGSAEIIADCANSQCRNPVWASDNRRLIYEQRTLNGEQPRLWWLDTQTLDSVPVFSDEAILGYGARFSADSSKVSFIQLVEPSVAQLYGSEHSANDGHNHGNLAQNLQQIVTVFAFETSESVNIPNLLNTSGVWHPTQDEMLLTDMQFYNERFGIHIFHVAADGKVIDFAENTLVEDTSPTWSPDGARIAFGRKQAQTPMGAQLWLMQADGSDPKALTQNSDIHHGRLAFSADGGSVLFQRYDISNPQSDPGIWLFDLATATARPLAEQGMMPTWLP